MIATQIARVVHEANRALQVELADPAIPVSPSWDETDEETQRSAVEGVQAVLNDPDLTPEQSHEGWVDFKIRHGWTYGAVKDLEAKEHPLLVPFGELSATDRAKDVLFISIIRALADA